MKTSMFRKPITPVLLGLVFYSCTKTQYKDDQTAINGSSITLEQARDAFQSQTKLTDQQFVSKLAPSRTFNHPQWEKALLKGGANQVEYWIVPLKSLNRQKRILYLYNHTTKERSQLQLPDPWLLIYRDSTKQIRVLVQQTIPSIAESQEMENAMNNHFNGKVKLYDWSGKLMGGFKYENGKRIKRITPVSDNKDILNARWETVCISYFECHYSSFCMRQLPTGGTEYTVVSATTSGEMYCDPPPFPPEIEQMYANASCDEWQFEYSDEYLECEMVWMPDDPGSDPYPDPDDPLWPGAAAGWPDEWWLDDAWLDANFNLSFQQQYRNLTAAERALVRSNPVAAMRIRNNREPAETMTVTRFGLNGLNDRSDAFRHAYFQALNTLDVGSTVAQQFADAHETEVPTNRQMERTMDLFNNGVGIWYGIHHYDRGTMDEVIWDALQQGELRYLNPLDFNNFPATGGVIPGVTQMIPTNQ